MKSGTSKLDQIRALRESRAQSSRGGVEGHAGPTQAKAPSATPKRPAYSGVGSTEARRGEQGVGIKSGPRETKPPKGSGSALEPKALGRPVPKAGATRANPAPATKRGRPKVQLKPVKGDHAEPWLFAGVSRRTWYRRKKEQNKS